MEKRWGLDLDMSAVRLMRRDDDIWTEIIAEKIDGPDIEDRLSSMVSKIDADAPVTLFLPQDQILYTDVDLGPAGDTRAQIERAMDGRTPYGLDELELDWELSATGSARVAAIARDTLDEAAAFAEVRGLKIAAYSSLATPNDFPRLPSFDGPMIFSDDAAESDEQTSAVQFTTARQPSRPPGAPIPASASARVPSRPPASRLTPVKPPDQKPVVHVDDANPVMRIKEPSLPLNPGIPVSAPNAPPRVRTDIAASTVSGQAASLTPPPSVKVRKSNSVMGTVIVLGVAFLITIGVAILVWNLLPLSPGEQTAVPELGQKSSDDATAEGTEDRVAVVPDPAPEPAPAAPVQEPDAVTELPAPVAEPEPEVAETPDLPLPSVQAELLLPKAPESDALPEIAQLAAAPESQIAPKLLKALRSGEGVPSHDPTTPNEATPQTLAKIATSAPFPGPEPDLGETTDDIYFASFEPTQQASDAIALPSPSGFRANALPQLASVAPTENVVPDPVPTEDPLNAAIAEALKGPGGLIPTDLARSLSDRPPRARPGSFVQDIERQQFGGRSRSELAGLRPPPRPESAQAVATTELAPPSQFAVAISSSPRARPRDIDALVANARLQSQAAEVTASAAYRAPDTSSAIEAALEGDAEPESPQQPQLNIPTSASVARQATIENAIRLNKVNLVGVYGAPSDRRALVRLPSGRYVKVKVGDRVDGGTVAQITDSELLYRKGNRTVSLELPKG